MVKMFLKHRKQLRPRKDASLTKDFKVRSPRVEQTALPIYQPTTLEDMGWGHLDPDLFKRTRARILRDVCRFVDCMTSEIDGDVTIADRGPFESGDMTAISRHAAEILVDHGKAMYLRGHKKKKRRRYW